MLNNGGDDVTVRGMSCTLAGVSFMLVGISCTLAKGPPREETDDGPPLRNHILEGWLLAAACTARLDGAQARGEG